MKNFLRSLFQYKKQAYRLLKIPWFKCGIPLTNVCPKSCIYFRYGDVIYCFDAKQDKGLIDYQKNSIKISDKQKIFISKENMKELKMFIKERQEQPPIKDIVNFKDAEFLGEENIKNNFNVLIGGTLLYSKDLEIYAKIDTLIDNIDEYIDIITDIKHYILHNNIKKVILQISNAKDFETDMINYWNVYQTLPLIDQGFYPYFPNDPFKIEKINILLEFYDHPKIYTIPEYQNIINQSLFRNTMWCYQYMDTIIEKGESSLKYGFPLKTLSFGLNIPLVYPSGRPKTTMKFLEKYIDEIALNTRQKRLALRKTPIPLEFGNQINYFIPITLYGNEEEYFISEKCGIIYYLEPNSDHFLNMGSSKQYKIFTTKMDAALYYYMKVKNNKKIFKTLIDSIVNVLKNVEPAIEKYKLNNPIENETDLLTLKYSDIFKKLNLRKKKYYVDIIKLLQGIKPTLYSISPLNYRVNSIYVNVLYKKESALDNAICLASNLLNCNVNIFNYVSGDSKVNSEVLDTRDKLESFRNIYVNVSSFNEQLKLNLQVLSEEQQQKPIEQVSIKENITKFKKVFNSIVNGKDYNIDYVFILTAFQWLTLNFDNVCTIDTNIKTIWNFGKYEKRVPYIYLNPISGDDITITRHINFMIKSCLKNINIQFIAILLIFTDDKNIPLPYANILFYDKRTNEIERFEPTELFYDEDHINDILKNKFKSYYGWKYIPPKTFCVRFQNNKLNQKSQQEYENEIEHCGMWSLFYLHLRLLNPDLNRSQVSRLGIEIINNEKNEHEFSSFIQKYTQFLIKTMNP